MHRSRRQIDSIERDGIPVTSHMRTLEDIARRVPRWALLRAVEAARGQGRLDLTRAARVPAIREVLCLHREGSNPTRSDAEAMFLTFLADHRIPIPLRNVKIAAYEADAVWFQERVIVELDGREFHDGELPFEADRRRGVAHRAAGYEVIRVSYRLLVDEPEDVAAAIRSALRATAALT